MKFINTKGYERMERKEMCQPEVPIYSKPSPSSFSSPSLVESASKVSSSINNLVRAIQEPDITPKKT